MLRGMLNLCRFGQGSDKQDGRLNGENGNALGGVIVLKVKLLYDCDCYKAILDF